MLLRRTPAPTTPRALLTAVSDRVTPTSLAVGRSAAGAVMLTRPRALPRLLGVDSATAVRLGWAVQMLGAREVALGVGTVLAWRRPDVPAARLWLAMGVLCDAADALVVGGALRRGRVRADSGAAVLAVALTAVALGGRALRPGPAGR